MEILTCYTIESKIQRTTVTFQESTMLQEADIKVYYAEGVSFVALNKDTFFAVSDKGKHFIVKELPPSPVESSEHEDNRGQTSSHTRKLIEVARQIALAMLPVPPEKGA